MDVDNRSSDEDESENKANDNSMEIDDDPPANDARSRGRLVRHLARPPRGRKILIKHASQLKSVMEREVIQSSFRAKGVGSAGGVVIYDAMPERSSAPFGVTEMKLSPFSNSGFVSFSSDLVRSLLKKLAKLPPPAPTPDCHLVIFRVVRVQHAKKI